MNMRSNLILFSCIACGQLMWAIESRGQGVPNNWLPLGTGDYASSSNWDAGGVPQLSSFEERAVINNGGTAFLEVATVPVVGGIDVSNGTLDIRRGGALQTGIGSSANGTLTVGSTGTLTLGGIAGSSAANLDVAASASIQGALNLLGPNAHLTAASLGLSGPLALTITTGGSSTLQSSGTATLGGTLQLSFNGVTPTAGNSWNIVDAANISGTFSQISSNATLGPGLYFVQQSASGGTYGSLARVVVDAKLVLQVNRRTGATEIRNLTSTESISLDAYYITSPSGALVPNSWSSFNDNGFTTFVESNPSEKHIGELSISGSRTLGPNTSTNLGNIFSGISPLFSTTAGGDLTFDYHETAVGPQSGVIDYVGPHNNLVLVVNPNGQTFLQNQSTSALDIDGYTISSATGSLNIGGWASLADSNSAWTEGNPSNNHIGELRLNGSLNLSATSAAVSLGSAFTTGATKDLVFQYHLAGGGTMIGIVEYEDGVINFGTVPGDFNNNGIVDSADYVVWRKSEGTSTTLPNDNGIGGIVGTAQYNLWRSYFGASAGSGSSLSLVSVPEPASHMPLLVALGALVIFRIRSTKPALQMNAWYK